MQANVTEEAKKPSGQKSSIGQRWITALIAMPIVLIFVWFGGWAAFAGAVLVVGLGTIEFYQMVHQSGYHPLIWVSASLSLLFLLSAMFLEQRMVILEIGLGAALLISFFWLFVRKKMEGAFVDWAITVAMSLYLGWSMSYILVLRGYQACSIPGPAGQWIFLPRGAWWVLTILLGVWGFDAAAFFAGRYFGRHKLAPHISPGKTWEGVLGGLVLSIAASLLLTVRPLGVPWYFAIVLGILLGCAAVVGDLAESLIKRQMHVKDSGQMMPGHGGMLDRIDSLLFVAIMVYLFAQVVGI